MNGTVRRGSRGAGEGGFSMIELLMAAFIMAIGLLGLTLLLVMSVGSSTSGRLRNVGTGVGQNILESVDSEARQQRLFRTLDPADPAPALSGYFSTTTPVTKSYNIYGTVVNTGSADPLERVAVFTTTSICSQDTTGTTATSGTVYSFQVVVNYREAKGSSGTLLTHSQTFRRKVAL